MPTQQGQTDEILKVTLTSRILGAHWSDDGAAAGGKAAYEVKTQYVGDGAPIKVTFKDLEGKTLSTVEGSILSNLHRGLFTASAANATGGVTFEAELPKHGLKVAGGRLKTGKPIEFSAMRFTDPEGKKSLTELPEGKPAACEAKVKGLKEGDKVLVSVHLRTDCVMQDGHLFVEGEVPVKDGKVVLLFTPKVKTRLDAIRIQAELDKEGGTYFQPEYVFACRAGGVRVVSEPAKAVQELIINFWEFPGQAGSLEGKQVTITGPDGKKETKNIPKNGTIVIPNGKPGRVSVLADQVTPLRTSSSTSSSAGLPEGLDEISFQEAIEVALKVTVGFEGEADGYETLAGNFDGQGISFGIVQFNFKQDTLGPLFKAFLKRDEPSVKECFKDSADRFKEFTNILAKPKDEQLKWSLGIQDEVERKNSKGKPRKVWVIKEAWAGHFRKLAAERKFQEIQKEFATGPYSSSARRVIAWLRTILPGSFGKISLRSYCALYDMCIQQGGISSSEKNELSTLLRQSVSTSQYDLLKILTDFKGCRASNQKGRWRADAVSRRWGILNARTVSVEREDAKGKTLKASRSNSNFVMLVPDKVIKDL